MLLRPVLRPVLREPFRSPFKRGSVGFAVATLFAANEPGFHAETYNPDSLLQRVNLLLWSEDLTKTTAWSKTNATTTATTATATIAGGNVFQSITPFRPATSGYVRVTIAKTVGAVAFPLIAASGSGGTPTENQVILNTNTGVAQKRVLGSNLASNLVVEDAGTAWRLSFQFTTDITNTSGSLTLFPCASVDGTTYSGSSTGTNGFTEVQVVYGPLVAYQKVTDWNTEYLAAASSRVHLWQDNLRTVPVTAAEQTVGCWDDLSPNAKHATQATTGSRPKLSARYNLLTKTEQFDDATWAKSGATVTANVATDPLGGTGAEKVQEDGTTGFHSVSQTLSGVSGAVRYSVYLKAAERNFAVVGLVGTIALSIDLTTGATNVLAGVPTNVAATSAGNGWWLVSFAHTAAVSFQIFPATGASTYNYAGTVGSGVYVWGADARLVNDAALNIPAYQRVNTPTDYDTAGFIHYLKFDGIDDSFVTPAIDFSGVDKMTVWAGATKLSDAATGIVAELTANSSSTDGGFYAAHSLGAADNLPFNTRGTVAATTATITAVAAPKTAVLTSQMDNAAGTQATQLAVRMDGTAKALTFSSGPTTAGNFANAALNIGRRNNASLPFNGRLTSLTVRGSTTPASDAFIKSTEQYAAKLAGQTFTST